MKFEFTRSQFEYIKDKAMLSDELSTIFELKIKGLYDYEIADKLGLSDKTYQRRKKLLMKKIKQVL